MKAKGNSKLVPTLLILLLMLAAAGLFQSWNLSKGVEQLRQEVVSLRADTNDMQVSLTGKTELMGKELAALKKSVSAPPKNTKRAADTTVYDVDLGKSPIRGASDARVTIVEFSDFQCPYCIREWPKLTQILEEYPKDVRVVFKHYPLPMHPKAKPVHAATILAQQQLGNEGFWKMHDLIIKDPKKIEVENLRGYAETLDLDLDVFDRTMRDPKLIDALLADDLAQARRINVRGTPTVMINGLKLASREIEDYRTRIEEVLKADKGNGQ